MKEGLIIVAVYTHYLVFLVFYVNIISFLNKILLLKDLFFAQTTSLCIISVDRHQWHSRILLYIFRWFSYLCHFIISNQIDFMILRLIWFFLWDLSLWIWYWSSYKLILSFTFYILFVFSSFLFRIYAAHLSNNLYYYFNYSVFVLNMRNNSI